MEKRELPGNGIRVRNEMCGQPRGRLSVLPTGAFAGPSPFSAPRVDSLLPVLWRNRWILLLCVVSALGLGVVYIQRATPIYISSARLYLDYADLIPPGIEADHTPRTDKYLYTQAGLIRSIPILSVAAEALAVEQLRTFASVGLPGAYLQRNLDVEVGKKDEIITVSLRSPYPVEAAQIVNRVVDTYVASRSDREQKNSAQMLRWLEEDMTRATRELEEKRNKLTDFQDHGMALALGSDQGGGVPQRYLEYQAGYTQAQIRMMDAEAFRQGVHALAGDPVALRRYVQARGGTGFYGGAESGEAPLQARLVDLQTRRQSLLETLTPDHPEVARLTREIERVEETLRKLDERFVSAVLAAAEQQYVEAKEYEQQLARLYAGQREQVKTYNAEVAQYQRLRAEVDQLTTYTQALEQQIWELRRVAGEEIGQMRMAVLEPALPADVPCEPQKSKIMTMALLLGLLFGGGLATARGWLDQTLRSIDEISALFGLPVLGAVPALSRCRHMQKRGQTVHLQPDSHQAEAFRTIRTAVFFGTPSDKARTILVTSPVAGDGKSTLVSNLGIAIAHAGQKTLILDADFRKPTQHVIFALDHRQRCLSNVFAGKIPVREAIQPTGLKGLHLLTGGHGVFHPAEVLNSDEFVGLLRQLAEVYDRILIDAPPVTVVTDAQIIGARCDATVLVLRADKSTRKTARRAIDALQGVGAHLLGVVVNQVRQSGDRYGYYYERCHGYYGSRNGRRNQPRKCITAQPPEELPVGTAVESK
jgi:succinoglycan biosynthesis transport protein ExoP